MKREIDKNALLSGPIFKHVVRLATPMIIAFIFVSGYLYVDRYFVSQLGDIATAAIGMAFVLQMLIISVGVGVGSGVNSFIARNLGAKNTETAENTIIHALLIAFTLGIAIAALGLLFQRPLFQMLGAEDRLLDLILAYLTIIFLFTPINLVMMITNSIYQGWGDTMSPMKFMLLGNILNLILDPILIFGMGPFPELGIEGAAFATGVGRTAALLYFVFKMFVRHQPTKVHFSRFRMDRTIVSGIFQVGLPSSVSQVLTSVAMGFVFFVLDPFGSNARAAYTIVFTYEMMIFLPAIGISQAVSILTGHNFGARHYKRVNKVLFTGIASAFTIMSVSAIIIISAPTLFAGVFAQSPEVLKISARALAITAVGHFFSGIYLCSVASFQGLGLGRHYLAANVLRLYLLQVPFVFFGAMFFNLDGVWFGLMLANAISAMVLLVWHQFIFRRRIMTGYIQPL